MMSLMGMVNIFYSFVFELLWLISMYPMTGTLFLLLKYSRARKDPPIAAAWFRHLYLEYLSNILAVPIDIAVTKAAEITSFVLIYWKKKLRNPGGYKILYLTQKFPPNPHPQTPPHRRTTGRRDRSSCFPWVFS